MRPEKLRMLVNKGIQEWLDNESNKTLLSVLPAMKKLWKRWAEEEGDFRTGRETYSYNDQESVRDNLFYISDRWRCAFRLKWIIDGLELGYI